MPSNLSQLSAGDLWHTLQDFITSAQYQHTRTCRHLTLPLISAERAWSLAKEVESQPPSKEGSTAYRHQHQIRRFAKAAQWAAELARLAAVRGNSRTHLEAEAYAAGLAGLALQQKGHELGAAVSKFQRAECAPLPSLPHHSTASAMPRLMSLTHMHASSCL